MVPDTVVLELTSANNPNVVILCAAIFIIAQSGYVMLGVDGRVC